MVIPNPIKNTPEASVAMSVPANISRCSQVFTVPILLNMIDIFVVYREQPVTSHEIYNYSCV